MMTRALNPTVVLCAAALFLAVSCSEDPSGPEPAPIDETETIPTGYPPIPEPSDPLDLDQPDQSEIYTLIVPIAGKPVDFAPTWSAGTFTWEVDIQTQYNACVPVCEWSADAPGAYWNGTRHSSGLIFEGGIVNLTNPSAHFRGADVIARQLLFVEDGEMVAVPRNPGSDVGHFNYMAPNEHGGSYPSQTINPCLFVGSTLLQVEPGFLETERRRQYYVAATSAAQLTNPVYVRRERFWTRVLIDGAKSVRVDDGNSKEVTHGRTEGTNVEESTSIAHTFDAELEGTAVDDAITGSLGYSLTNTFETTVTVTEEVTEEVTRVVTGIPGKTVIFSVWSSVDRYTIVDLNGEPYTDPSFTFSDLGITLVQGEHEWLASTIFDE